MKYAKKFLLSVICIVLVAAMALTFASCANNKGNTQTASQEITRTVIGEGDKSFDFTVTDKDGKITGYTVKTNAETVGEALAENKLIGTEKDGNLTMVTAVLGQKLDYNTDKMYWSFLIDGQWATTGAFETKIEAGVSYAFTASK
ncbi:MAG: hypothetical protein KBS41_04220 [Oscillospiraceae bacterium]|nr:hypothetical protein [Candidatus Equicaccousia limihippi]